MADRSGFPLNVPLGVTPNAVVLGTAATQNTGTSGATIPLLNGANTWSGVQIHSSSDYFAIATLTDGATIDWNGATQQVCKVTLGGNRTMNAPTNIPEGLFVSIRIIQDGTGSRTQAWNTVYKFTGGTAPTLTTTASAVDFIVFQSDGTNLREMGRSLNVS